MKYLFLKLLVTLNKFLQHIISLGLRDGVYLFFLNPCESKEYKITLKATRFPFFIRGNSSDSGVITQVFYQKDYEISLPFIPSTILDCGANIGLASIYFKNRFPDVKIITIEPESENFQLLRRNLAPYSNIHFENKGLWSEQCSLEIISGEDGQPWSFFVKKIDAPTKNSIEAIGIQDIIEKYSLDYIDLLKIDIEGSEYELFNKNYDLWLPKVKVIIIELHDRFRPFSSKPFLNILSKYNFNIYFQGENIIAEQDFM